MTVYSVYEPPADDSDVAVRADKIAFVKEGFSWPALLVPVLWLLYQRMWIELILFVAILSAVPWLFGFDQTGKEFAGWVSLALTILFAFEANDLRGWALQRRGYRFAAVATGRDRTEAERSFFTAWLPQQTRSKRVPEATPRASDASPPARGSNDGGDDVIGLFPQA